MTRARVVLALRLAVAAILLWAAAAKVGDPQTFATDIVNYRAVPAALAPLLAVTLPFVEAGLGLALLAGLWLPAAALGATALLGVFSVIVLAALVRGIDIRCGCFGGTDPLTWWTLVRDLVLVAVAGALYALVRAPGRAEAQAPA